MQLKWKYIQDEQPEHNEEIIQCNINGEADYTIGIRKYNQNCSWDKVLLFCKHHEKNAPNFWWISAKDFTFPDKGL